MLVRMQTNTGGGTPESKTLWSNSSPTASYASATVTLSEDISNYDYLEFVCRFSTSNGTSNSVFVSVADFKKSSGTTGGLNLAFSCYYGTAASRIRNIYRASSDTTIIFGSAFNAGGSGYDNAYLIPIEVRGIKTNGGGLPLNPTALKAGYVAKSGTVTQTIDLNKTYILSICTNANAESDYMDTFLIDKGDVSFIHDSSGISQTVTVSGNTLSFTNSSSTYARSYCLTQLN